MNEKVRLLFHELADRSPEERGRILAERRIGPELRAEVESLLGDATKAREKLGWTAEVSFDELVTEMMESDLEAAKREALIAKEGYRVYSRHE